MKSKILKTFYEEDSNQQPLYPLLKQGVWKTLPPPKGGGNKGGRVMGFEKPVGGLLITPLWGVNSPLRVFRGFSIWISLSSIL